MSSSKLSPCGIKLLSSQSLNQATLDGCPLWFRSGPSAGRTRGASAGLCVSLDCHRGQHNGEPRAHPHAQHGQTWPEWVGRWVVVLWWQSGKITEVRKRSSPPKSGRSAGNYNYHQRGHSAVLVDKAPPSVG